MSNQTNPKDFAELMVSFKKDTLKLCKDYREGRIFDTRELVLEDANEEDVIEASCVKDITGVSFFSLGPVYVTAQVPYSFLDQYCGEVSNDQFMTITTPPFATGTDVIDNGVVVGTWDDKIHATGKDTFDNFTDFMCSQVLSRDGKLFGISFQDVMTQDPVLREKHGVSIDNLMRLRCFLPYTIKGEVIVNVNSSNGILGFTTRPSSVEHKRNLRAAIKAQSQQNQKD